MMDYSYFFTNIYSYPFFIFGPFFLVIAAWSLVWKGIALWKAGRNNQLYWYIALLIINTFGILEIIYLFFFRKNMNPRMTHLDHIPKNIKKKRRR